MLCIFWLGVQTELELRTYKMVYRLDLGRVLWKSADLQESENNAAWPDPDIVARLRFSATHCKPTG